MAKSILRLKARELRQEGESIIVIAKKLSISKGTISKWCRDMVLSEEQLLSDNSIELRLKDKSKIDNITPITSDQLLYEISTLKYHRLLVRTNCFIETPPLFNHCILFNAP